MPSLAEMQARFAAALRDGGVSPVFLRAGVCSVDDSVEVYRRNVAGAAVNALATSFPTVVRLVGGAFFRQLGRRYFLAEPPRSGCLWSYGATFADFLAFSPECRHLPYLADVARLDRALDQAGNTEQGRSCSFTLDARTRLELDSSLRLLELEWPADEIREALELDEDSLTQIAMDRTTRRRVLWRSQARVLMRPLSEGAYAFLRALLAEANPEDALVETFRHLVATAADEIEQEILRAPFARIILTEDVFP